MIDTDGDMGTACDCQNNGGTNCVHCLIIEHYHQQFEEPVLDGVESFGAFGVAGAHLVPPAIRVGEIARLVHLSRSDLAVLG